MNFRVISAPERRLPDELYEDFKDDYLNSTLNYNELRAKYDLSKKEYGEVATRIKKEEGISHKPFNKAKYYYRNFHKWNIVKRVNGRNVLFGTLPMSKFSEKDIKRIVKQCKEWRWDYEKCTRYINSLSH